MNVSARWGGTTRWWATAAASLFRFQQQRPTVCRALKSEQMGKAGIAAVMANGMPQIKALGDLVSEADCDHDGVAELFRKLGL